MAAPIDRNHGTLKLCFDAGGRTLIFETAYHLKEEPPGGLVAKEHVNNIATNYP